MVHAAAGGVGLLLTQIIKIKGGKVLAVVSSEAKRDAALDAGADAAVLYSEDWVEEARKFGRDENGVDVAFDSVGTTLAASLVAARKGGHVVFYGMAGGDPEKVDPRRLVVERRRGGFCYELNGLFAALLRALGFDVAMLSARVANAEGSFGPDFDHMALMVTLDERWLADVGFGDSFYEPLLLDKRDEQAQGARAYRIVDDGTHLILMRRDEDGEWKAQYRFTLQPYQYADYAGMCRYHQTSPKSHFTQQRICTRATPDGRITLSEMRLITTKNGERLERMLTSEKEYAAMLGEHFNIYMPG